MGLSYTTALGAVFGGLVALAIILVIGIIFLWLALRSHERMLMAELQAGHQRLQSILVDVRVQQTDWERQHACIVDASTAFSTAAKALERIVENVYPEPGSPRGLSGG